MSKTAAMKWYSKGDRLIAEVDGSVKYRVGPSMWGDGTWQVDQWDGPNLEWVEVTAFYRVADAKRWVREQLQEVAA